MTRSKKKPAIPRSMRGELPGELQLRSMVSIPSGRLGDEGRIPEDDWIVRTRLLAGKWTVVVKFKGEEWTLPDKVVVQIERHMKRIKEADADNKKLARSEAQREKMLERMDAGETPFQIKSA